MSTPDALRSPTTWLAGTAGAILIAALGWVGSTLTSTVGKVGALEARDEITRQQLDRIERKLDALVGKGR